VTRLMGRSRGEAPRVTREVVRDLLDGLNGARAHVNGHVLLDADGGFLAFALCHACGPARSLLPKPKEETEKKKKEKKKECKQTHPLSLPPVASLKKVAVVLGGC